MTNTNGTTDLLARARELLAAITPGEWRATIDFDEGEFNIWAFVEDGEWPGEAVVLGMLDLLRNPDADAAFIAAAPSLVRDLCAAVEASEAEVARLRAQVEDLEEGNWPFEWVIATEEREKRKAAEDKMIAVLAKYSEKASQLTAERDAAKACMKTMQDPPARIADLDRVLRSLTDDHPGAGFRRLASGNWYCAYCGVDLTGHINDHDEACPVAQARALLEASDHLNSEVDAQKAQRSTHDKVRRRGEKGHTRGV